MSLRYQLRGKLWLVVLLLGLSTVLLAQENVELDSRGRLGGWPNGAAVSGDFAFLAQSTHITVLDVSGTEITKVGGVELEQEPNRLFVHGDYLLVFYTSGDSSLQVLDISNPTEPKLFAKYPLFSAWPTNVTINGSHVYHCSENTVSILDVSNPAAMTTVGFVAVNGVKTAMGSGNTLLAATGNSLLVFDITDLDFPVAKANLETPKITSMALSGNTAFLGYDTYPQIGLEIMDISDLANPSEIKFQVTTIVVGTTTWYKSPNEVQVLDGKAYVGCAGSADLFIFDVADPANPEQLGVVEFDEGSWPRPESMTILPPYAYLGIGTSSVPFIKIDISDLNSPVVEAKFEAPKAVLYLTHAGDTMYVAGDERLWVYVLNDVANPELIGSDWNWPNLNRLKMAGDHLLAARNDTLFVLDVSQPENITAVGEYPARGVLREVAAQGDYAYLLNFANVVSEVEVVNIVNPASPVLESVYPLEAEGRAIFITDPTTAYVAFSKNTTENGVMILDAANPAGLTLTSTTPVQAVPSCLWAADTLVMVGSNNETENRWHLESFGLAHPQTPVAVAQRTGAGSIWGLHVHEQLLLANVNGSIDEMAELDGPGVLDFTKTASLPSLQKPNGSAVEPGILTVMFLQNLQLLAQFTSPSTTGFMAAIFLKSMGILAVCFILGFFFPLMLTFHGSMGIFILGLIFGGGTGVEQMAPMTLPAQYQLEQNYPNPFNPETTIEFTLQDAGDVKLSVFDLLGREVATLIDEHRSAGTFHVNFQAHDLPSGMYVYQLKVGDTMLQKQMLVVK